jgi:hypothetical protein
MLCRLEQLRKETGCSERVGVAATPSVPILAGSPAIQRKVFHGFPQFRQANTGIVHGLLYNFRKTFTN